MSRWVSEGSSNGGASADDGVTKQWLRDMGVPQQTQPARQENKPNADARSSDLIKNRDRVTSLTYPKRQWQDSTDDYHQLTTRRRHCTTEQERSLSTALHSSIPSDYHNDIGSRLVNSDQKNSCHYKSCNMIGYIVPVKDNIDQQFYQARSIHHIPDNGYSNKRKQENNVPANSYFNNYYKNYSSPNLAISSQGLEYICNFRSSTSQSCNISNQINGCLMQARSVQDLSTVNVHGIHGNHHPVSSVARSSSASAYDKSCPHGRRRKHNKCLII